MNCENFKSVEMTIDNCQFAKGCANFKPKYEWKVGDCFTFDLNGIHSKRMIIKAFTDGFNIVDERWFIMFREARCTIDHLLSTYTDKKKITLEEFLK